VKKVLCFAVALAVLGSVIWIGGRSGVMPEARGEPTATGTKTRIATLNLKYVVTNYQRYKSFLEENKNQYKQFEARIQGKTKVLEGYRTQLQDPKTDAATRENTEKQAKALQRELQDLAEEARQTLGKKEAEQLVLIYKEVYGAVHAFATSQGIDLVLHYSDGVNELEMNSAANIAQKMNQRACVPFYFGQNVDISVNVVQMLNARFPGAAAAPATSGTR
jgi:Skp family chaperone for outer membrane proteins